MFVELCKFCKIDIFVPRVSGIELNLPTICEEDSFAVDKPPVGDLERGGVDFALGHSCERFLCGIEFGFEYLMGADG